MQVPYPSRDASSEDEMCLKRTAPDVFVLDEAYERVAVSSGNGQISRSSSAGDLDAEILAKIRTIAACSKVYGKSPHRQFICSGKFVRVLALDGKPGCIVIVEPLRNRARLSDVAIQYGLSVRELQVLELIVRTTSRIDIAQMLEISETTVQSHIGNIGTKMQCSRREAIIARALGVF